MAVNLECEIAGRQLHLARRFERAFFVFGLRRGGNHAIAEWLMGHFAPREIAYLYNAPLAPLAIRGDRLVYDQARDMGVLLAGGQTVCIIGYENTNFLDFPLADNSRIAARNDVLVVLRDFPNMAASIVRSARERPAFAYDYFLKDFPAKWAFYARHFRDRTRELVYLSYNDWFKYPDYRQRLSLRLGLEFSDRGLNRVARHGGGSSFDGRTMHGRAQAMNVLNRWAEMWDDDLFLSVLLEGDNLELNAEILGHFPYDRQDVMLRRNHVRGLSRS